MDWHWLSDSKEYLLRPPYVKYTFFAGILYDPVLAAACIDFRYHAKTDKAQVRDLHKMGISQYPTSS